MIGSFMERGFAVIGLGYVGLPVALALAKQFERVIGFDISQQRIAALRNARDTTGEVTEAALRGSSYVKLPRLLELHEAGRIAMPMWRRRPG